MAGPGCVERPAPESQVTIFAAASTISAVEEISARFGEQTGIKVATSFAASSSLATTLNYGAQADLFLSASPLWAETVMTDQPGCQKVALLGNELVVVVPRSAAAIPRSILELASTEFKKIAIADPQAVPAGVYARQTLESAGLWSELEPRMVGALDVRHALNLVDQTVTDCGFVYRSDAQFTPGVRVAFAVKTPEPVIYPLVLLPEPTPAAKQMFEFLQSAEAGRIFEKHGFSIPAQ